MSSAVMERPVAQQVDDPVIITDDQRGTTVEKSTSRTGGPIAWLASLVAWVMVPSERGQRGITTIEYIFGAILAIAIVTVVVTVIRNPAVGELVLKLIEWALNFRGK